MQTFTDLFEYHTDGFLIRKVGRYKGQRVGFFDKGSGYNRVKIKGRSWLIHRVIYLMHYPDYVGDVDHKDRNKLNNKIENLRPCTRPQNVVNSKVRKDNPYGYKGVTFHKASGKYAAQTMLYGKRIHIGLFPTPEEAGKAYNETVKKLFEGYAKLNEFPK